jgi:hypothetical protein
VKIELNKKSGNKMSKKEIEQLREDLELLKTNELIEIIIDQDEQLNK